MPNNPNASGKLPTLQELHYAPDEAFKHDQLNLLLNQPPHNSWLKEYPAEMGIKQGGKYLPIDKVEFLLTRIFQRWKVEVKQVIPLFNSVAAIVRLHYLDPISGEWLFQDGGGAKSVQTQKGASASDLGAIKDAAVMIALPSAISFAIKDAAEHIGTIFGRDLNRKDTWAFAGSYADYKPEPTPEHSPTTAEPLPTTTVNFEL